MNHRRTLIAIGVIAVVTVAALLFTYSYFGPSSATHSTSGIVAAAAGASRVKIGIATVPFVSILLLGLVRCWLFVRIANRKTDSTALVPPLDPPIRI